MTTAIENLQSAQAHAKSIWPKAGGFPVLAKVLHQAGVHRNEWFLPALLIKLRQAAAMACMPRA